MPDKSWKAFERRMCRDMGTERIPVTGERAGADGQTSRFALQFKLRRVVPSWLFEWLDGIVSSAQRTNRVGVLVLKRPHMRDEEAIVCLRWIDWLALQTNESTEKCV